MSVSFVQIVSGNYRKNDVSGQVFELVEQFKTGLRCHTLADYCYGLELSLSGFFDRKYIRERAVDKWDMYKLAINYDYTFRCILDVHKPEMNGWYAKKSHLHIFQPPKIYLIIVYYGSFPNYFQLYLDSLGMNKDLLTVILVTDIPLNYKVPTNVIHVNMKIMILLVDFTVILLQSKTQKNLNIYLKKYQIILIYARITQEHLLQMKLLTVNH
jgi:hypothetical protein